MSVKRYEANGSSSVFEDASGSLVEYEDYAALERKNIELAVQLANAESKFRELAAENTGLNKFIKSDCWIWDDKSEEYFDAADCMPETPTSDAFLAEVRVQGVEELASLAGNECKRYKSVNDRAGVRK
ncbi:MAG: hypothetical protein RSE33_10720 [Hafnia sp.]